MAGHQLLWWQAPTNLNAHLSLATKDIGAVRIYAEPLADFDAQNQLVPILAAEIPSVENGGVAAMAPVSHGSSSRASSGTMASRSPPAMSPSPSSTSAIQEPRLPRSATTRTSPLSKPPRRHRQDHLQAPGRRVVQSVHRLPGQILPEHILKDSVGTGAKDAPFNLKPIGTGPYKVSDFKPGDVVTYDLNPDYHSTGKPYFEPSSSRRRRRAERRARGAADW